MSATDHSLAPGGNGAPAGQEPDRVMQDRGVSPIAGRPGGLRSRWITLAALAVGCGAFLFATWTGASTLPARRRRNPRASWSLSSPCAVPPSRPCCPCGPWIRTPRR